MSNTTDALSCDLLVIGGGMAGMTAAGRAAETGAKVIVVEKGASHRRVGRFVRRISLDRDIGRAARLLR